MDTTDKSFDLAIDTSKLLITISTGIIALTITFLDKETVMKPESTTEKIILLASWIILLGSVIVGIWTRLAFTDVADLENKPLNYKPSINSLKIKFPFQLQAILFVLGVIAIIIYGCVKIF
jgi:hypothetical protein